jgi:hypothetical protein
MEIKEIYERLNGKLENCEVLLNEKSVVVHHGKPLFDDELNIVVHKLLEGLKVETWMGFTNGVSGWICIIPRVKS